MQHARGRPAAQPGTDHKHMQTLLTVQPGDRVADAHDALAQCRTNLMSVNHPGGRCPGVLRARPQRHGNADIRRGFFAAGKPKGGQGVFRVMRQGQQIAGVGRWRIQRLRYQTACFKFKLDWRSGRRSKTVRSFGPGRRTVILHWGRGQQQSACYQRAQGQPQQRRKRCRQQ